MDRDFNCKLIVGPPIHVAGGGSAANAIESAFQSYLCLIQRHLLRVPWNSMDTSFWVKLASTQ